MLTRHDSRLSGKVPLQSFVNPMYAEMGEDPTLTRQNPVYEANDESFYQDAPPMGADKDFGYLEMGPSSPSGNAVEYDTGAYSNPTHVMPNQPIYNTAEPETDFDTVRMASSLPVASAPSYE